MAGFKVTDAGATDAVNFTIPRSGFWIGLIVSVKNLMSNLSMTRVARAPYTDGESERNEVYAERPCQSAVPANSIMKGASQTKH